MWTFQNVKHEPPNHAFGSKHVTRSQKGHRMLNIIS
jgi:hypothetical protein